MKNRGFHVLLAALALLAVGPWWLARQGRSEVEAAVRTALDLHRSGNAPAAVAAIDRALEAHPRAGRLYAARARVYLDEGLWEQALESARKAADLTPSPESRSLVGESLARMGRLEEALDSLDRAINGGGPLWPDPPAQAYLERGELRLRLAKLQEAVQDLDRSLEMGLDGAGRVRALRLRAKAKISLGDPAGGVGDLDLALSEADGDILSRLLRAQARLGLRDFAGAEEDAKRALAVDPNNGSAFLLRAEARIGLGRNYEALRDLRRASRLTPGNPRIKELKRRALGVEK